MRLNDIFTFEDQQELTEIDMSPTGLMQQATAIPGVLVGMEFEMIVPNVNVDNDEYDGQLEPDYDQDRRAYNFEGIVDFFFDNDFNSRRDVQRLREALQTDFDDWVYSRIDELWQEDAAESINNWMWGRYRDTYRREAIEQINAEYGDKLSDNDREVMISEYMDQAHREAVEQTMEEGADNPDYESVRQEWENDNIDNIDFEELQSEWLRDQGMRYMSDVQNNYDIAWPYYTQAGDGDGEIDIDSVAQAFGQAIGRPVNASQSYHGARREPGKYVVEPDGSLNADDDKDAGLEFVSPPLPLEEMLSDLVKVKKWAEQTGCYTNKSTGLHMNVSIPGYSLDKLDYVKLAILLGDQYVLQQFGRASNTYAGSAMEKIVGVVKKQPDIAQGLLNQMRTGLQTLASKALAAQSPSKYTSINTHDRYVEFRSPGGDWLNEDLSKLQSTVTRFIVALDAAMDPEKHRREYLSKLRNLLTPRGEESDIIKHFVDYSAGQLPKQALKGFIRQAQLQRKVKRGQTGDDKMWWRVGLKSNPNYSIEVVGRTRDEAVDAAMEADPDLMRFNFENDFTAVPVRPFSSSKPTAAPRGSINYEIFNVTHGNAVQRFSANSDEEALAYFDSTTSAQDRPYYDVRRARLTAPETEPDANFAIVRRTDNQVVGYMIRNTRQEAERDLARQGSEHLYTIVDVQPRNSSTPIPGSTLNLQRQRAAAAEPAERSDQWWDQPTGTSGFTGTWRVMIDGEEVHRFSGVGNIQADALRVGQRWVLDQIRRGQLNPVPGAEVEVVPEMR